jgi:environmental stress-induced protein Ves
MSLELLPADDRAPVPWRNGGGVTFEIAAEPVGAADFAWRLSLAIIEAEGPFSEFPEIDRTLLVAEGRIELGVADRAPRFYGAADEAAQFPGDIPSAALLPDGPAAAFNLMTRRGAWTGTLERRVVEGAATVICQDVTLVLAPSGGLSAQLRAERLALRAGDGLCVRRARGAMLRLSSAHPDEVIVAHVNRAR